MKKIVTMLLMLPLVAVAQVKIPKDANRFTYWQFEYGNERTDTTVITVERNPDGSIVILTPRPEGKLIPGYAQTVTSVDYAADSITVTATYDDDTAYYYRTPFSRSDLEWRTESGERRVERYTTSVNSNTLTFEMDERAPVNVNPLPHYGLNKGTLLSYTRNGQLRLKLAKAERVENGERRTEREAAATGMFSTLHFPLSTRRVSPRQLDRIMKERLVVTTRIFDHEQICWGKKNDHVEGDIAAVPTDTVLHFAGGTLILKRVELPDLPHHYQHFIELHQQSNGDAYDRTGSLFIVTPGFFEGINGHPDSLPIFTGRDGQHYQGMMRTESYEPPIELVRFFTPFGVGHYNERMAGYGIDWRPEAYYRQEVTDIFRQYGYGSHVVIGAWIGNYDGGGHLVTVDLKSYPNDYVWEEPGEKSEYPCDMISLFNTCNVLEMAGQNYGKLFGTDSLTVTFTLEDIQQIAELRFLATGHGGWGEGDEFVPKTNTILIDGKVAFTHTPWREDCGCYRDLNPVSGNFWNGLSSSDFSRSGWCPGTATQPVYFDLSPWADGKEHTLTVAIPQGKSVEGMFSHWAVSGVLIVEY